jgi:hypothetical protein
VNSSSISIIGIIVFSPVLGISSFLLWFSCSKRLLAFFIQHSMVLAELSDGDLAKYENNFSKLFGGQLQFDFKAIENLE